MGVVAVMIPPGGYSGSLVRLIRRLEEHGIEPVVVCERTGQWRGEGGVEVTATRGLADLEPADFAAIICVDGEDERLARTPSVPGLLREAWRAGAVIAGLGDGLLVLAHAGLLARCAVAADKTLAERLREHGAGPVLEPVVTCGRIITAVDAAATELADEVAEFRLAGHAPP